MATRGAPRNHGMLTCHEPSASTYAHGCRCEACRTAQRQRMRDYYRSKGGNLHRKPEVERARYERLKAAGKRRHPTTEADRAHDARRRAVRYGATAEKFSRIEIFDRDDWSCGICDEPVDRELQHPHPLSPSLDHIIPLSLGGHHTRQNVRCSHLTCNVRRGNRVDADALEVSA